MNPKSLSAGVAAFRFFGGNILKSNPIFHASAALLIILIVITPAYALSIRGQVMDMSTGNPVPDANVHVIQYQNVEPVSTEILPGRDVFTITDMAGMFSIGAGDLPGLYTVEISHVGYKTERVTIKTEGDIVSVKLKPRRLELSEVIVTVGREARSKTPAAISNLSRSEIDLSYGAQDVPLVAAEIPGAAAFSWSGSDVGAAEIRIRGFGQDRIAATVNGVPVNDPEDHNIYWQDTPDFLTNTFDLQVQRGVSNYQPGPSGVAGGLSLVTSDAVSNRELAVTYQGGSFNTARRSLAYRSGIIDGKYNFTGRFSRVTTDGYRDHTATDAWSYFLAATRYDSKMVTRMQVYGGQEEMDAYWWGIDKNTLETNRRANYSAWYKDYHPELFPYYYDERDTVTDYRGERDFFQQPHYMLHNQWRLNPDIELNQSFFWIQGKGFYEEWKLNRKFSEYNLIPFEVIRDDDGDGTLDTVTIDRTDLIRRKNVTKEHVGWLPSLNWKISSATSVRLGLELREYKSDHWGNVVWARELPAAVTPQHEWYQWKGSKDYMGGHLNIESRFSDRITANAGLQVRNISWKLEQAQMGVFDGVNFDVSWLFVNPHLGLTYKLNPATDIYFSLANASREPVDDMIYDADNPQDIPKLDGGGESAVESEEMVDLEVGARYNRENISLGVNFYAMFFRNEIVKTGFSSELDGEVFDNAPTSQHIGVEFDGAWDNALPGLAISGNISLGTATLGEYSIQHVTGLDENWEPIIETVNLKGNQTALSPQLIANLRTTYRVGGLTGSVHIQHVSRQFMDNREDDAAVLNPYTVLNGTVIYSLAKVDAGEIDFELRGMNLLDAEYEPFGIVDVEYGTPYYVPAAGRRYLAGITLKL